MLETNHIEEWRPVKGYEGIYSVSSLGRIRRDKTVRSSPAGRFLSLKRHGAQRYIRAILCKNTTRKTVHVHTVVLEAFVCPRPTGLYCNHKNGNTTDNRPENLEWVTPLENTRHAIDILGKQRIGEANSNAKLSSTMVEAILTALHAGKSKTELAQEFGVTESALSRLWSGKTWKHVSRTPFCDTASS